MTGRTAARAVPPSRAARRRDLIHKTRLALAVALTLSACADPDAVVVFAAASATDVVHDVARQVEAAGGGPVLVSVGASSVLARQIGQGAPADVFVTADGAWAGWLVRQATAPTASRTVAGGRLVVVGPAGTPPADGAAPALVGRVALADPSHVPAGRYARDQLTALGLWADVEKRAVATGDVRAALAAVEAGAVDRAVVYATDARGRGGVAVVWALPPWPAIRYQVAQLTPRGAAVYQALAEPGPWRARGFEPPPAR